MKSEEKKEIEEESKWLSDIKNEDIEPTELNVNIKVDPKSEEVSEVTQKHIDQIEN